MNRVPTASSSGLQEGEVLAGALPDGEVAVSTPVVTGPAAALPATGVPVSTPVVTGLAGEPPVRGITISTQVSTQGDLAPHGEPQCVASQFQPQLVWPPEV